MLSYRAQDQIYFYQSKKDEMEEARITYGIDENSHSILFWNPDGKRLFQDLDIDGRIYHNTSVTHLIDKMLLIFDQNTEWGKSYQVSSVKLFCAILSMNSFNHTECTMCSK
jgi:hypothetical protein